MTSAISRPFHRIGWGLVRSLFLIVALSRCIGADPVSPRDEFFNMPAVGMSQGGFGFAVNARDWTYDQSFTPDLTAGSLQVGLVIAGYTRGTGRLNITDAADVSVFSQNLAGNIAAGNNTVIHGAAPFHVRVTTTGYSGTISLGLNTAPTQ